jgi:hypothetical protein
VGLKAFTTGKPQVRVAKGGKTMIPDDKKPPRKYNVKKDKPE